MQAEIRAFLASLDAQPSYSTSTRLAYANDLARFYHYLQRTLQRSPQLSDIDPQSIASFLDSEKLNGKRSATLLRRKAALRLFMAFLSKNGYPLSPLAIDGWLAGISFPSRPQAALPYLATEQVQNLMQTIEHEQRPIARRDSAILALLLHTGITVSKLISLDLTDVNLYTGNLHLSNAHGEPYWHPLDSAARYLDRYIKEGRPDLNPFPGETALFISQIGSRLTRQSVWQILRHWGTVTQASIPITPRLIRNTAALQLRRSGLPISRIQALLGHSNPLSTQALLHRLEAAGPEGLVSSSSAQSTGREVANG